MKKILSYLKPYWWIIVLTLVLVAGQIWFELRQPLLMSKIVDDGILIGDMEAVKSNGLSMIINALITFILSILGAWASTRVSIRYGHDLRRGLYEKIQTLSFKDIDRLQTGSLITRLTNDINQIQNAVQMVLRMTVVAGMLMIGSLVIVIGLNPRLAMIFLVAIPVLLVGIILLMKATVPLFEKIQKTTDTINTVLQENFSGARVVRAYDRGAYEEKRFDQPNKKMLDLSLLTAKLMALTQPLMMLVLNGTMIMIVWLGGQMFVAGEGIQVGEIMAMINYSTQILFSMLMASFVVMMAFRAYTSARRIAQVMRIKPDITSPTKANQQALNQGLVELHDVDFKYEANAEEFVLQDINLKIEPGEMIAIMGPTGSGKTTLVNLIGRYYEVNNGWIKIDGIDVREFDLDCLHAGMATVTQSPTLFSGTIADNLRWGKKNATEAEMTTALKTAQAWEFVSKLKGGLNAEVKQLGSNFSGGQKQRLSLARALIRQPKILILDDATSALDLETESKVRTNIRHLKSKPTTILVVQRVVSAMASDRIVLLNEQGRIEAIGSHQELMKRSRGYQEIYQSQLHKGELLIEEKTAGLVDEGQEKTIQQTRPSRSISSQKGGQNAS